MIDSIAENNMPALSKDLSFEGLTPKGLSKSRGPTRDSLVKALASIDIKQSSSLGLSPTADACALGTGSSGSSGSSDSSGSSGDVDSGYATATTTPQSSSPETKHTERADTTVVPRKSLFQRKVTKLKSFDKPIPTLVRKHFEDLLEFVGKPLYNHVVDAGFRYTGISMKLRVLGTSEETAKPWIIVQCDKALSKKVKQFFNQSQIKSQCASVNDDASLPPLEVLVVDRPPRPTAAAIDVWAQSHHDDIMSITSCGMVIKVGGAGEARVGTLGGIIQVTYPGTGPMLYGMSAGHVLAEATYQAEETVAEVLNGEADPMDESILDEEEYELDLDFDQEDDEIDQEDDEIDHDLPCQKDLPSNPKEHKGHATVWSKAGHVHLNSCDLQRDAGNLDWALIELEDQSLYRPNLLVTPSADPRSRLNIELSAAAMLEPANAQTDRPVALLNSFSGLKNGILKQYSSYLMLAPGKNFTKTHDLMFTDGSSKSCIRLVIIARL